MVVDLVAAVDLGVVVGVPDNTRASERKHLLHVAIVHGLRLLISSKQCCGRQNPKYFRDKYLKRDVAGYVVLERAYHS